MYNGLDRLAVDGKFPLCQLLQFRLANPFTELLIVFFASFKQSFQTWAEMRLHSNRRFKLLLDVMNTVLYVRVIFSPAFLLKI
jgi:hypothetical protein